MPFQIGSVAVHDDGQHTGSAKRNVGGGVVGLHASGAILGGTAGIWIGRDGSNDMLFLEGTSGERAFTVRRVGANDYTLWSGLVAAGRQLLDSNMKNVANGVAGLDANIRLSAAQLPANLLAAITPTFSGWNTNPGTNANLTDESLPALTTNGVTANGVMGTVVYDLGANKAVNIAWTYLLTVNGADVPALLEVSNDNTNWRTIDTVSNPTFNNPYFQGKTALCRYIRFSHARNGAGAITYTRIFMGAYKA